MKNSSLLTVISIAFLVVSFGIFAGCDDDAESTEGAEAAEEETEETDDSEAAEEAEETDDSEVAEDSDSLCGVMCQQMADCDVGDDEEECVEECQALNDELEELGDEECIAAYDELIACQVDVTDCDELEAAYMGESDPCEDKSSAFQEACF